MTRAYYRSYVIERDAPPIPDRSHDYRYAHVDYDGGPEETGGPPADRRCGTAATLELAMRAIDEIEDDK